MIWIVILLIFICIIGSIVTGGHYIAEPDREIGFAFCVFVLLTFILLGGTFIYENNQPMVQYTCKAYHTDGKTSIIKPIRRAIEDKTVKQLDDNFGDKTIYRCDILKADTIKK